MKIIHRYNHGNYIMLHFDTGQRMLEHRFVMEQKLGRKLLNDEVIHHIDNDGKNNNINNLELNNIKDHSAYHSSQRFKATILEIPCFQCGKIRKIDARYFKYNTKKGQKIFCSRKCSGKYGSEKWKLIQGSSNGRKIDFDSINLSSTLNP